MFVLVYAHNWNVWSILLSYLQSFFKSAKNANFSFLPELGSWHRSSTHPVFCCSFTRVSCLWSGNERNGTRSRYHLHRSMYLGCRPKVPRQGCEVLAVHAVQSRRTSVSSCWRHMGEVEPVFILLQPNVSSQNNYSWIQLRHGVDTSDKHEAGIFAARKLQLVLRRLVDFGTGAVWVGYLTVIVNCTDYLNYSRLSSSCSQHTSRWQLHCSASVKNQRNWKHRNSLNRIFAWRSCHELCFNETSIWIYNTKNIGTGPSNAAVCNCWHW